MPKGKKGIVFAAAACHIGEAPPKHAKDGYAMLARLFGVAQSRPNNARPATVAQDVSSLAFLESYEWRRLRMQALVKRGARCECCGATPKDGVRIHVDHIKPRRLFPALALDETNLQILCEVCNHGKGNWDQTDWRADQRPEPESVVLQVVDPLRPRLVRRSAS